MFPYLVEGLVALVDDYCIYLSNLTFPSSHAGYAAVYFDSDFFGDDVDKLVCGDFLSLACSFDGRLELLEIVVSSNPDVEVLYNMRRV